MDKEKIEASKKDAIVKTTYEKIYNFQSRGYAAEKQSTDIKKWLEEQDEVESVSVYGDTDITVKFKDKTQVGILLNRKKIYGGVSEKNLDVKPNQPIFSSRIEDPHPISQKAAVIDTLRDDWPPISTPDDIINLLKGAGYDIDDIQNDSANLKFFSTLDDNEYGVVFIRSHGGMMNVAGDDKLHIMVRPFFTSFPPASGYSGVGVFTVGTDVLPQGYAYAYAFNDGFVKQYMNNRNFPNSLFHLLVCHGGNPLAKDDMIKAFIDRCVGCYTGWTANASLAHGDPAAVQFFKVLCDSNANPPNTVADAINQITSSGHSPDPQTSAVLVAYGANAMQIIGCYIIKEVSRIIIRTPSGTVIGKGFHDIFDAFEYSTNLIIGGKYSRLRIVHNVELKKVQW
jgi:hypothetical protein